MDPPAERPPMHLEGSDEDVVAVSDEPLPPLTDDHVRALIEQSRDHHVRSVRVAPRA